MTMANMAQHRHGAARTIGHRRLPWENLSNSNLSS